MKATILVRGNFVDWMLRHVRLAGTLAAVVGLVILYAATLGSFQS